MSFRSLLACMLRSRATWTFGLVVALLWAPIWGQWHGIAHQVQQVVVLDTSAAQTGYQTSLVTDDGHELGSALCQVLDHLGHASALTAWPAVVSLAILPMVAPAWQRLDSHGLQPWWPSQARAPPHRI